MTHAKRFMEIVAHIDKLDPKTVFRATSRLSPKAKIAVGSLLGATLTALLIGTSGEKLGLKKTAEDGSRVFKVYAYFLPVVVGVVVGGGVSRVKTKR